VSVFAGASGTAKAPSFQLRDVTKSSLPSFRILDVENGATTRAGTISFRLARSIEGSEISRYTVYVNNNKVDVTSSSATFGGAFR
jgi:hypothetical protein